MSGREHQVITGNSIIECRKKGNERTGTDSASVWFAALTDKDITLHLPQYRNGAAGAWQDTGRMGVNAWWKK
ncbi:MAG: Maf family protein [Spirochaetales bacterium]|nr:Maf family protein [Spirochaetales bacterium]